MANRKAEIKSKKRTLYLKEDLYNLFSEILKSNGKTPSEVLNKYMEKVVNHGVEKSVKEETLIRNLIEHKNKLDDVMDDLLKTITQIKKLNLQEIRNEPTQNQSE